MSGVLFYLPSARPLSMVGRILSGWKAHFFITQTTTPTPVYSDGDLSNSLGSVVTAEADGQMQPIYLNPAVVYRVQMYDENGALLPNGDVDPIDVSRGEGGGGIESIVAGTGIEVDDTDPANPIVSAPGVAPKHAFAEFNNAGTLNKWTNSESVTINPGAVTGLYAVNFTPDYFDKHPVVTANLVRAQGSLTRIVQIGAIGFDFAEVFVSDMSGNLVNLASGTGITLHAWEPDHWTPPG